MIELVLSCLISEHIDEESLKRVVYSDRHVINYRRLPSNRVLE